MVAGLLVPDFIYNIGTTMLNGDILMLIFFFVNKIITVEEHSVIGGLGEAVCSLLSEKAPTPVRRIGVQDKFGHSGPAWEVLRDYGLTADAIADAVRSFVKEDQ